EQGADWIRHHHERYDGTGYPDGLKGEEIPLGARIIAVADAFDAMLYDRPYKAGRPLPEVIEEFKRSSGTHFDPKVVEVLLDLIQDPRRVAELTRPPELSFIEFVGTLNGPVAVPSARQEAAAADEPRP
ncbi:MAG TPA: HD domain-containing phosphohydrolase, partial [Thermaerobacter sp.]